MAVTETQGTAGVGPESGAEGLDTAIGSAAKLSAAARAHIAGPMARWP
jgi:hypothetical protein